MTTFQDPPPQSRRSARQTERGGAADGAQIDALSQGNPSQVDPALQTQPQQYLNQQPAGQQQPSSQQPDTSAGGRRARAAEPQNLYEVPPEPLNYTTQGAPYTPQPTSPGYAEAPQESAQYRVRDFSPEGGASGRRASAPPLVEPPAPGGYGGGAGDINYQTQGYGAAGTSVAAAPTPPTSRREQRQRQAEQEAATGQVASLLTGELPYNPTLLAQTQQQAAPQQPPQTQPQVPIQPQQAYPTGQVPLGYQGAPTSQQPHTTGQVPLEYQSGPPTQPPAPTALSGAKAEFEALTRNGQLHQPPMVQNAPQTQPQAPVQSLAQNPSHPSPQSLDPAIEQTDGWVAPAGHWSRQADLDDETQPYANTITREVGGGNVATTTSALVLPDIPRPDPYASVLTTTGEVLLTGSIDLPRSLGSTGGDARLYDDPGVDHMFDSQDAEFTGTDSAPVRAIRAVSTHSGSRGVIHANKPRGNRLITVVFVVTAVLAVAVVGMLVASISLGLF